MSNRPSASFYLKADTDADALNEHAHDAEEVWERNALKPRIATVGDRRCPKLRLRPK
jgi:hypothetical protein